MFGRWIWAWLPKPAQRLFFNIPFLDNERALYAIVPHTTAVRGGRFEVVIDVPWLQRGAFDIQGIRHIPGSVFMRKLGVLSQPQMDQITAATKIWFGII
jgi:mRNA interferase MazF